MKNDIYTIKNGKKYKFKINKSLFIGHSFKIHSKADIKGKIENINNEFDDATHNCWAYILGIKRKKEKYNDDGEPSGTAGKPILNVLKKNKLTNTLIIVTRYFGGIKLGAGGLIRAYSKASQKVLNKSKIKQIVKNFKYTLTVPYEVFDKLENYLSNRKIYIVDKDFKKNIDLTVLIPENYKNDCLEYYKNLVKNKYKPIYLKTVYL